MGTAYDTYPYDATARRVSTITWTVTNNTKVLFIDSYAVAYNVNNTLISKTIDATYSTLVATDTLPVIESNTVATATLTPSTLNEETAAFGSTIPTTHQFVATNPSDLVIGDDPGEVSNIDMLVRPQSGQSWLTVNNAASTAAVAPKGQFTVNATDNTTGALRTATVTLECSNSRISPPLADHVITITQLG